MIAKPRRDPRPEVAGDEVAAASWSSDASSRAHASCSPDDYAAAIVLKTLEAVGRIDAGRGAGRPGVGGTKAASCCARSLDTNFV